MQNKPNFISIVTMLLLLTFTNIQMPNSQYKNREYETKGQQKYEETIERGKGEAMDWRDKVFFGPGEREPMLRGRNFPFNTVAGLDIQYRYYIRSIEREYFETLPYNYPLLDIIDEVGSPDGFWVENTEKGMRSPDMLLAGDLYPSYGIEPDRKENFVLLKCTTNSKSPEEIRITEILIADNKRIKKRTKLKD